MEQADLDAVGALAGRLVRLHVAFDPLRFLAIDEPERGYARYFGSQLRREEVVLLVAEAEGPPPAVVGYAFARLEPLSYEELRRACGKLHDLYVDEAARGGGVGEALLREALGALHARGAPRVVLTTAVQNEAAQRLFAKVGFRTTMLEMTREATEA